MTRLLIITDCFLPRWDGVARFLIELILRFHRSFQITIVAPDFPGEPVELPQGVTIHRVPLIPIKVADIQFAWPSFRFVRSLVKNADIVFTQTIGPLGTAGAQAAHKLKVPHVAFIHSIEWELAAKSLKYGRKLGFFLVEKVARWVYSRATLLLCPTREVAELLTLRHIESPKEIVTLGVDTLKFGPPAHKQEQKMALGFKPEEIVIGYHGRIAREKNLPTLLKAFRQIRTLHPHTTLLIVGSGITDEISQKEGVRIVGSQNDVVPFLQAMDIYVTPSLLETSSLSTMEAMAVGLPVIATNVGMIPEYIRNGENGFLFQRKSVKQLVNRLHFLVTKPDLRARLGEKARETIRERYDLEVTVGKIQEQLLMLAEAAELTRAKTLNS